MTGSGLVIGGGNGPAARSRSQWPRREVVEQGVRVGLGRDAHAAGITERVVVRVDPLRAVPVYLHMIPLELGAQLVPDA
jgi:hypothetical protein